MWCENTAYRYCGENVEMWTLQSHLTGRLYSESVWWNIPLKSSVKVMPVWAVQFLHSAHLRRWCVHFLPLAPECKCNGHAQSCHFDWTAWRESGQRSGGVCDCLHNTEGRQCQKCKAGFYRDPQRPQSAPDSCKRKIHKHRMYLSKLWRWFVIGIIWSI